jgi:hypothetical protein
MSGIKGWEKCTLLTKPEQSGKTFLMLQKIVEDFSEDPRSDGRKYINFLLCDNNLLLVLQTSYRIKSDEELYKFRNIESDEIYIEFSSSKRSTTNTSDSVFRLITTNSISNIVCCSNARRCEDIFKIMHDINKVTHLKNIYHFNIWFDEADKFTNLISDYLVPALEQFDNVSLYAITATPERIIKFFREINIWAIENPTLPNYHGWNDNEIIPYDDNISKNNNLFVEHILNTNKDDIKPNTRWFIPADITKISHLKIKDLCRNYGFATMIINGDGIIIYMPDGKIFEEDKNEMPDVLIPKLYNKYKLNQYPFVITGHQCISRGISISSNKFMLSHSIMPLSIKNKSELSQIAGRMKGNQKGWSNYKVPKIFCSNKFNKSANEVEEKTKKLAEIAFEENWETVTLDKFKMVEKDYYYYQYENSFDSYKDALIYLSTQEHHLQPDSNNKTIININKMLKKPHCHETPNGYFLTTKLHKKKNIVDNIDNIESKRLTIECLNEMSLGSNLSEPNSKNASYIIYPVYETLNSKPNEVKYYVRHTIKKNI